jgi:sodium transport system permease protein
MSMQSRNILLIFRRELLDQLRDRRTLFTIAVLPVLLYPIMGVAMMQILQFRREHATRVLLVGSENLPEKPALVKDNRFHADLASPPEAQLLPIETESLETWNQSCAGKDAAAIAEHLKARNCDAAIIVTPELASALKPDSETSPTLPLYWSSASDRSVVARHRVERVLEHWRAQVVRMRLAQKSVSPATIEPFTVAQAQSTNVAKKGQDKAAMWAKLLPFVVFVWALTGAFYPAIDLCAGEKERGTLETLLSSPALRGEIVWGKMLTIMTFSLATSLLNLLSLGSTGLFLISRVTGDASSPLASLGAPPLLPMAWLILAMIPLSAMFSALSLAIAAFARSSKEGQYYLMPLLLVMLPLMMLPLMPAVQLDLGTSLIPVTGLMLLLKAFIEGQYYTALPFVLPVFAVTAACCGLAIRWAIDQFNNESVLFRESEQWGLRLWLSHLVRERKETPGVGEALMCGLLILIIRFAAMMIGKSPASAGDMLAMTAIQLIAIVLIPAVIMAIVLTRSPLATLQLRRPQWSALWMAALLAVVIHPAAMAFSVWVGKTYPLAPQMATELQRLTELFAGVSPVALILAMAVTPAICEELAFRGFILSGLRHTGRKWTAILVSSVFFGAAHGILQQSITATVLGIVLAYVTIQSGSIFPAMAYHLIHNSFALCRDHLLQGFGESELLSKIVQVEAGKFGEYQPLIVVASAILTVAILNWFRSQRHGKSREEWIAETLDRSASAAAPVGT